MLVRILKNKNNLSQTQKKYHTITFLKKNFTLMKQNNNKMSSILTTIAFVKSVSGSATLSGIATARLDDDEYMDFHYKAFNVNVEGLVETIQPNTIMLFIGKYVFQESQLYVSIIMSLVYFPSRVLLFC